ncbi:hypothetical protein HaLaN_29528 [Haematococcus lacustris]|uniref:Uncharacterized protein n=1 Tax=Haematococcus lacustris TaxID=44745 RepID=A0A6A0AEE7_HAELA|nr:hypothetical protein HaLaN_29528 [Haematococcus lacustris]
MASTNHDTKSTQQTQMAELTLKELEAQPSIRVEPGHGYHLQLFGKSEFSPEDVYKVLIDPRIGTWRCAHHTAASPVCCVMTSPMGAKGSEVSHPGALSAALTAVLKKRAMGSEEYESATAGGGGALGGGLAVGGGGWVGGGDGSGGEGVCGGVCSGREPGLGWGRKGRGCQARSLTLNPVNPYLPGLPCRYPLIMGGRFWWKHMVRVPGCHRTWAWLALA